MPAFLYSGNTSIWNPPHELYRVEVFTDEDCLNPVFRGAITGAPAYVPRPTGPLALPTDISGITGARTAFLPDGTEPPSYSYDYGTVKSNESDVSPAPPSGGTTGLPPGQVVNGREDRPLGQQLGRRALLLDRHARGRRARRDDHDHARERRAGRRHHDHRRQRHRHRRG